MKHQATTPLRRDASVLAIVPHFACEEWLADCLTALTTQTRPLDGIVVVDDASTTPPVEIVAQFPGVTLLTASSNVGPYRLVQQVIDATNHDAYLFQDADDWSSADRLELLLEAGEETGAELIGSDYVMIYCDEAAASLQAFPRDVNAALAAAPTAHALQHPTSLVARALLERVGGFATGMRFSGDAEFLRRAAHVARVVNVPRPLYFRRLRTGSLTTAPETGHGSPARRSVLDALAERAWSNVAASARGDQPLLEPFLRSGPVELRHVAGPQLGGWHLSAGACRSEPSTGRESPVRPPAPSPVFVVGAPEALSESIVWSLGQHPQLAAMPDASWLSPLAVAAEVVGNLSGRGHPVPNTGRRIAALDPLGLDGVDLLDGVAATIQAMVAGLGSTWVASLPPTHEAVAAAAALFPNARLIHVVRHVEDVGVARADEWLAAVRVWLDAEERFGRERVLRVRFGDLVDDPDASMRNCLAFSGVAFHEPCTWPLRSFRARVTVAPPAETERSESLNEARSELLNEARSLSTALCGPPSVAVVDRTIAAAAQPVAARTVAPVPISRDPEHVRAPLALLRAAVPGNATVAIVSNGDSRLVDIGNATGWHFPRQADGEWVGYHPASSRDAIRHLTDLQRSGAGFVFFPYWALWWLDHYDGLREHLEIGSRVTASSPDAGLLLELGSTPNDDAPDLRQFVPVEQRRRHDAAGNGAGASTVVELRQRRVSTRRHNRKVAVIAWSASHNPLGRAYLLAEMLERRYDVELIGARFDRFGHGVWEPLRDAAIPTHSFPGTTFPEHLRTMKDVAGSIDADAILVCKPRLPSLSLGILAKAARNRPLILDVDDRELTFVDADSAVSLEHLERHRQSPALTNPFGRLWTQYCESLIPHADRRIVSNASLQELYGGTIIPHARDERVFDPDRFDRERARARHGFEPDERIILFAGTPRRHKGITRILEALRELGDTRTKLCLIGTVEYRELHDELEPFDRWLRVLPYQPFGELPSLLAASDAVCVLQDPHDPVSQFQIPAKVTDALAMRVPCVVTPVPPLAGVIAAGGVLVHGDEPLTTTLTKLFDDPEAAAQMAARGREHFLRTSSYAAVGPVLDAVIESQIDAPRSMPQEFSALIDFQERAFGATPAQEPAVATVRAVAGPGVRRIGGRQGPEPTFDVALFWKQNDTGIYGRRHDMLLQQLVASPRVGNVVQFDAPVDLARLTASASGHGPTHDHLINDHLVQRLRGRQVVAGLAQYTFGYNGQEAGNGWLGRYVDYVRTAIDEHRSPGRRLVFWVYPKNFELPELVQAIDPDLVVADIVDDHRTWAQPGSDRWHLLDRHYADVAALSDVLVTNCDALAQSIGAMGKPVHVVPNGCEYPVAVSVPTVPTELEGLPGPIVGYLGNLSDRLDVDLLERLALELPDASIVLIGSTHAGTQILRLDRFDNVHILGPRPYDDAKRFVRAFDVAIIPHVDNDMTRSMNPLKAFVYCALGVPVVSTRVANLAEFGDLIHVADDHAAFVHAVRAAAMAGKREHTPAQRERLLANTWSQRLDQILALVDAELSAPSFAVTAP